MTTHLPRIKERSTDALAKALGGHLLATKHHVGETTLTIARDAIVEVCRIARDDFGYQQLMEIAGADYPERAERFEVNYHLLSITENHRIRLKVSTDEATPVPSVTSLWPVAGWLEREVFDLYGVAFAGNNDLRRILTDYGFEGHPLRKDFPLTGHVEMRYSEAEKRVIYEPVRLPQEFRSFDFLMPWQGAEYRLPGDEKAEPQAPGAPSPAPASTTPPRVKPVAASEKRDADKPYATDNDDRGVAGAAEANAQARKPRATKKARLGGVESDVAEPRPGSQNPGSQGGPEAQ